MKYPVMIITAAFAMFTQPSLAQEKKFSAEEIQILIKAQVQGPRVSNESCKTAKLAHLTRNIVAYLQAAALPADTDQSATQGKVTWFKSDYYDDQAVLFVLDETSGRNRSVRFYPESQKFELISYYDPTAQMETDIRHIYQDIGTDGVIDGMWPSGWGTYLHEQMQPQRQYCVALHEIAFYYMVRGEV